MKIAILSRNPRLYSTRRLVEAARKRGHQPRVIDPIRCYMNISAEAPTMHCKGRPLGRLEAVIPRIGATFTFYSAAVVRQFEAMGVYALNGSEAILRARDKLWSLQVLARKGLGMPTTGFASSPDDTRDLVKMSGGPPLILKLLAGTQGRGVVLAETGHAAESVVDAFRSLDVNILIQEYIREAQGADIRCLVIGSRVAAAMLRRAAEGEFRSNLHQGGTAERVKITPEERALAVAATRALGLGLGGVDILRSARGPLVIEVNASPGLEGIEAVTGLDLAGQILDYVQEHAQRLQAAAP